MTYLIIAVIYITGVLAARYSNKKLNSLNCEYEHIPIIWIVSLFTVVAYFIIIIGSMKSPNIKTENKYIKWFCGENWNNQTNK